MRKLLLILLFAFGGIGFAQEQTWSYLRLQEGAQMPSFEQIDGDLVYKGHDVKLKNLLENKTILSIRPAFVFSKKPKLQRTYLFICKEPDLAQQLVSNFNQLFEFSETLSEDDAKVFYPNDYGSTNPFGSQMSEQLDLDYLDYLEVPKAWYYTTGSRDIIIGISDGRLDTTNIDFKGKSKQLRLSSVSNGHGYSISANAAAQGNNGYGIPGICYDCSLYGTSYGYFKTLEQLIELSYAGAQVINCSWGSHIYYETAQEAINEIYENGTIVVAAAHNKSWQDNKGKKPYYPASYDKVISVSSVMHRYDTITDNLLVNKKGTRYAANIKNYVGRTIGFKDNDYSKEHHIYPVSTASLNPQVDILAPSVGLFSFSKLILKDTLSYSEFATTSGATPLVSGTVGLMLSLNKCLSFEEVESILKMSSTNIDYIEANLPYKGNYGAGALNTGRAVTLTHHLMSPEEVATIENQDFTRWEFVINSLAKNTMLKNQRFAESATLNITASQSIELGEGVLLAPNSDGAILLSLDPALEINCPEREPENRVLIMPDKNKEFKERKFGQKNDGN
ncbi:MAG: S8 family serine peptidase [Gilvibacter sp.]